MATPQPAIASARDREPFNFTPMQKFLIALVLNLAGFIYGYGQLTTKVENLTQEMQGKASSESTRNIEKRLDHIESLLDNYMKRSNK